MKRLLVFIFLTFAVLISGTTARLLSNGDLSQPENLAQYEITAIAEANGKILLNGSVVEPPNNVIKVFQGDALTFTFEPDEGYEVDVVEVDDNPVIPTGNSYTIPNIQKDGIIRVTFKIKVYNITTSANTGGSISITAPSAGATTVQYGEDVDFDITILTDYELEALTVKVNNITVTPTVVAVNSYKIPAVNGDVHIDAVFTKEDPPAPDSFDVTLIILPNGTDWGTADLNGQPNLTIKVETGERVTLNYTTKAKTNDAEYNVASIKVNGTPENPIPSSGKQYTITATTTIEIAFDSTHVGIYEEPLTEFAVYPNPTTGNLLVKTGDVEITKIEVLNSTGVVEMVIEGIGDKLDLSNLGSGFYFLRVHSAKGIEYRNVILNK